MRFLAFKHLLFRKRQSFFTLLGIFFGTSAFVVISGFFLGFQNYLTDQLVSGDAHIKITRNDERIDSEIIIDSLRKDESEHFSWIRKPNPRLNITEINNPQGWMEKAKMHPDVIAASFQFSTTVLISKAGISQSANLIGTDIDQQLKITNIGSKVTEGKFEDLKRGMDNIVIGETLARDLGITIDDTVQVSASGVGLQPMKVVGIFASGSRQSERGTSYTSLTTAQKVAGRTGAINQISVRVRDSLNAGSIATEWKSRSKDKVESWDQSNASFLSIFQTQDLMRYATTTVLLLVAGFGIYNILSMVVMQKRKDIAILRSMGFDDGDVLKLFLLQGVLLGIIGSLAGIGAGFGLSIFLSNFSMATPTGTITVNMSFDPQIYVIAVAFGIVTSCIAAYLPSRSAASMTPIAIIRAGAE
jgi:lipoprotein-releasing system permease protein